MKGWIFVSNENNVIHLFAPNGRYNANAEREKNILGSRIAEARKKAGMSLTAFAELLSGYGVDVSASSISKWETGLTAPNGYQLMAVSHALDLVDMFTRFTGSYTPELNDVGQRKLEEYKRDLIATGLYSPVARADEATIVYIDMPISFLRTSAGLGQYLDGEAFERKSFPKSEVPEGADYGIYISGDSMEPVYHDGQIVWVQQCSEIAIGEVGIFIYDNEGYIKVYNERTPPAELREHYVDSYGNAYNQPVLMSYNCKYDPIPIKPEVGFKVVGRVLN